MSFSTKNKSFMKLKQLMLAPVALGMVAPVAANAADLNMAAVNQYVSAEQATSVTQFTDVKPGDWAYQALGNLIEKYGCIAGMTDTTFAGGKTLTRFEAAALLNACLERVTENTDELQRLANDFAKELGVLRGRVASAEKKIGTLEAMQFSTTTKLKGEATFVLGGLDGGRTTTSGNIGNTAFNYDLRLSFDTSFTGKDLLKTRLRSGNFSSAPFGSSSSLLKLDKAETYANTMTLDRLYYRFPALAKGVYLTAGAQVRNTEMAWIPSAYKSDILDFFQVAGAPGVYNKATGSGFGVEWVQPVKKGKPGFVANLNYVAQNGNDSTKGQFDEDGALNTLAQVGYRAPQYGIAFGYRYGTEGTRVRNFNAIGGGSGALAANQTSNGYAINAYWQPKKSGIIPSVSGAYGWNEVSLSNNRQTPTGATDSQTWFAGLQWSDVFAKGNAAGFAIGAPGNAASLKDDQKAIMWEAFYRYKVSDAISVTPAVFYVSNNQGLKNASDNYGGVIQTTFRF
jgi:Carbohydrate-selective porin, OprB family/S-layer homology domain